MTDIKQTQITKWGNARINHGGYYTITSSKEGKKKGKQLYGIMFKGELIKCSLYPYKLEIWFNKTHPNQRLVNKFGSG